MEALEALKPIPVIIIIVQGLGGGGGGGCSAPATYAPDLNNGAASPHNPDLISPPSPHKIGSTHSQGNF